MVADDGRTPAPDQAPHHVEHWSRIGAVADEIAEKDNAGGPRAVRVLEAGGERFEVGVDVREECDAHR